MAKTIAQEFVKGLWDEIPPFRLVLGLCPTLAVTKALETGYGMGITVADFKQQTFIIQRLLILPGLQGKPGQQGFGLGHQLAPPGVPLPNQLGIALEGLGCGEFLWTIFGPQPGLRSAKRGYPTFGRNAGSGENHHILSRAEDVNQLMGQANCHGLLQIATIDMLRNKVK